MHEFRQGGRSLDVLRGPDRHHLSILAVFEHAVAWFLDTTIEFFPVRCNFVGLGP